MSIILVTICFLFLLFLYYLCRRFFMISVNSSLPCRFQRAENLSFTNQRGQYIEFTRIHLLDPDGYHFSCSVDSDLVSTLQEGNEYEFSFSLYQRGSALKCKCVGAETPLARRH